MLVFLRPRSSGPAHASRRQHGRQRFILPLEWQRLKPVLDAEPLRIRAFFYLLLLAGPRRTEARRMRWSDLDLDGGLWHKPMTKTGRPQLLALPPKVCALLAGLPRDGPYVFHGKVGHTNSRPDQPLSPTAITYHWRRLRRVAGLDDVQLRDLRRTCASWLAMHGENLTTIQHVLNHANLAVTHVYARLHQEPIRAALTRLADRMLP